MHALDRSFLWGQRKASPTEHYASIRISSIGTHSGYIGHTGKNTYTLALPDPPQRILGNADAVTNAIW